MSGATLRQYTDIGKWRGVHYLALGGLNYLPIDYFLQQHPQVKNVVLCFDRDEPGLRFTETVAQRLAERGLMWKSGCLPLARTTTKALSGTSQRLKNSEVSVYENHSDCQPKGGVAKPRPP